MTLTARIASFASSMSFDRVPPEALERIKAGFADCIGVLLAGSALPVAEIAYRFAGGTRTGWRSQVLGGLGLPAPATGLVYGTAAHAQDFDDTGLNGHPSAVLVPAILAEAERAGADGPRMIAAYLAGFEVWAELSWRDKDQHHDKGWHPSPVFGVVAAAAAIANLRGFDERLTARALGIAASSAAGLVANFGTMTKPFQLGRSIQFAIEAADLAGLGLTAAGDAMEHDRGFLHAFSPGGRVDLSSPAEIGTRWRFLETGINIKLYPMCYATHRAIDAALELKRTHGLSAGDIAALEVEIGRTQAGILEHHDPSTVPNARFSAEFAVAVAAALGRCGSAEVNEATLASPEIRRLIRATRLAIVEERKPDYPIFSPFDRVRATLRDGRVVESQPVEWPRGHHSAFPTREELWEKFADTAGGAIGREAAHALYQRIFALEKLGSAAELYSGRPAAEPENGLPLAGLTVVELGTSVAGPVASMILGELGARVVKIENPKGDDARSWGPPFLGDAAAMFQAINRGKRSAIVDFKDDAQLDALRRFVAEEADIVLQNLRPGVVEKFGLDHAGLSPTRPDLIYCNMSAFGSSGPLAGMPGYDPLIQAFGGIMSVTGHEDAEPVRVGPSILDQGSGMWAVIGILAALDRRRATRKGARIDTSLFETALSWLAMHLAQFMASGRLPRRLGTEHGGMVPYRAYRAQDGWVVIAAANDNLFRRFADAMGRPEWADQPEFSSNTARVTNREALNPLIAEVIAQRPRDHWIARMQEAGVPCAAIQSLDEVMAHPQTEAVGMLQKGPGGQMSLIGIPLSFDGVRPPFARLPPALGEDTDAVITPGTAQQTVTEHEMRKRAG